MATKEDTGLEKVWEQLLELITEAGKQVIETVSDKLTDLANPEEGDGSTLAAAGSRILQGENPVKALVGEKTKDVKDKVTDKAKEAVGADGGSKAGDLKAINIVEHVDIGMPLRVVYNQWTQLEDFGKFTNGVSNVSMDDDDETQSTWKVRVWPSSRTWTATAVEQIPDERIVWTSEGSKGTTHGCVSFHPLADRLTRVVVVVEYYPSGFVEKLGNIWRAQGRRLRLDLKHFQRYVTLQADVADVEGWRGEIRDGEVVRSHDEVVKAEKDAEEGNREKKDADRKKSSKRKSAKKKSREPEDEEDSEEDSEESEEEESEHRGGRSRSRRSRE